MVRYAALVRVSAGHIRVRLRVEPIRRRARSSGDGARQAAPRAPDARVIGRVFIQEDARCGGASELVLIMKREFKMSK